MPGEVSQAPAPFGLLRKLLSRGERDVQEKDELDGRSRKGSKNGELERWGRWEEQCFQ